MIIDTEKLREAIDSYYYKLGYKLGSKEPFAKEINGINISDVWSIINSARVAEEQKVHELEELALIRLD